MTTPHALSASELKTFRATNQEGLDKTINKDTVIVQTNSINRTWVPWTRDDEKAKSEKFRTWKESGQEKDKQQKYLQIHADRGAPAMPKIQQVGNPWLSDVMTSGHSDEIKTMTT